jgi:hypothetical protein
MELGDKSTITPKNSKLGDKFSYLFEDFRDKFIMKSVLINKPLALLICSPLPDNKVAVVISEEEECCHAVYVHDDFIYLVRMEVL